MNLCPFLRGTPVHLAQKFDALGLLWRETITEWRAAGADTERQAVDRCTRHLRAEGWPIADVVELASRTPAGLGILATATPWAIREIWKDIDKEEAKASAEKAEEDAENPPFRIINVGALAGKPVPVRRWIVPNWLPIRVATLNYADGGIGKTLLTLQLMAATALVKPWCGEAAGAPWSGLGDPEPCRSLGLFCEDDTEEIHIRLEAIRQHYGASWSDIDGMCPIDASGEDNILVRFEHNGRMTLTPRFYRLRQHAMDIKARLVSLDTAATVFGGNENDRGQVTAFLGGALTRFAQDIDGAVLVNAHPSITGLANGDLRSGSTAWNNSCRSRWSLARPTDAEGKPDLTSPDRVLTRRKVNSAPSGDTINMRWERGLFVPIGTNATNRLASGARKDDAEAAFLAALQASTFKVSQFPKASNYAPKVLQTTPAGADFKTAELTKAMNDLLSRGCIKSEGYRQNSRDYQHLIIVGEAK